MSKSGIYGFFHYDMNYDIYILTIGRTDRKDGRLSDYRTYNAKLEFDFWAPVGVNRLVKAENKLKKSLLKKYKTWGNSPEQFEIGDLEDTKVVEKFLVEEMKMIFNFKRKSNFIDYTVNTVYGEVLDVRDTRKKCYFIPGEIAMITTTAGMKEKCRKYTTYFEKKGSKIIELEHSKQVYVSQHAWRVIRFVQLNERKKFEHELQFNRLSDSN